MDRDRDMNLKPLPKPVYKPPMNSRDPHGQARRSVRPASSTRNERRKNTPDDFPAVRRKASASATRDTYSAAPPERSMSKRKLRENRKRRETARISTKAPRKINQNVLFWGIAGLAFCVFIFVIVRGLTKKNAYEIFVDDVSVGSVMMSKTVGEDSVLTAVTARLKAANETDVRINENIRSETVHVSGNDALAFDVMVGEVAGRLTYDVMAASIYVNREMMGILKDTAAAEAVLDRVKAQFRQAGLNIVSEDFVDDVKIEPDYVAKDRVQSADEVYAALSATSERVDKYTLVEGDTLEKVSRIYNMTVDELTRANPGIIPNKLQIGQQLNITTPSPVVSVRTVEEVTMTEVEPMPVQYQYNPEHPASYRKIVQQGADGQREVTYHITRINGYKQAPVAVGTVITKAPVAQIEEIGTR